MDSVRSMMSWIEFRAYIDVDSDTHLTRPEMYVYLLQIKAIAIREYGPISGIQIYEEIRDEILGTRERRDVMNQNTHAGSRPKGVRLIQDQKSTYREMLERAA